MRLIAFSSLLVLALGPGCGRDERLSLPRADGGAGGHAGIPGGGGVPASGGSGGGSGGGSLASLSAERLFPTAARPGLEEPDCLFGSPLVYESTGSSQILVAVGEHVIAVDPETGAELHRVKLPADGSERAFVISTPVIVGHRLVVAYHTTLASAETAKPGRDVMDPRKQQRVAVVDLTAHALDPEFPPVTLSASVPAATPGENVIFRPDRALQRAALVHVPDKELGSVFVTFGNGRDLQPWHGWSFELSLSAWQKAGAGGAVVRTLLVTPEHDCGPEGSSGSRARICGGGLWSPSGPLRLDGPTGSELVLAAGNGVLDLERGDYANTLLRVRPGETFDSGCDAAACKGFDRDAPQNACVESCKNVFVPRIPAGDPPLAPESGVCDGLPMFPCWEKLDYVGGSSPIDAETPNGKRVLAYPTKDGHVYLVDAQHFGTLYQRKKLVDVCGKAGHVCQADWAGMSVTQPAKAEVGGQVVLVVPTFMPDTVHDAGVFGLDLVDGANGPELRTRWVFPSPGTPAARQRFRWHPSRATVARFGTTDVVFLVEPGTVDQVPGRLVGLAADDGRALLDEQLAGRGFRFGKPLHHQGVLYTPSCKSDFGPGSLEAHRLSAH